MWTFLGLVVFCSLAWPLQGITKEASPGITAVISQAAVSKHFATILLRNGLLQSHILAIRFPDSPHKGHPEHWIKGLHIVKVFVPTISLELRENGLAVVCIKVRLHFSAKFYFGKRFERTDIIVDADLHKEAKAVDFSMGIVDVKFQICKSEFKIAKIICPSHSLVHKVEPIVTTVLAASLPKSLCAVVQLVVQLARTDVLYTTNVLFSIGTVATIQYQLATLPLIGSGYVALESHIILRTGNRFITVPFSNVPSHLPSLRDSALSLGITQSSLNTIISVLLQIQVQEFICTPQVCPKCPKKSQLKITITLIGTKRIVLEPKRGFLELSTEIAIFAKDSSGSLTSFFVLKANLKLSILASVHDCKLLFSAKLISIELILLSSEVGPIEISGLVKLIHRLLVETFVPHVNDCLMVGIPLPSYMNINLAYPVIQYIPEMLVLCV